MNDVGAQGSSSLSSSGLDGDKHLAGDLPESRTVQSSEHPGTAGPLRGEKLGPGQGGASCDQTETSRVRVTCQKDWADFWCDFKCVSRRGNSL